MHVQVAFHPLPFWKKIRWLWNCFCSVKLSCHPFICLPVYPTFYGHCNSETMELIHSKEVYWDFHVLKMCSDIVICPLDPSRAAYGAKDKVWHLALCWNWMTTRLIQSKWSLLTLYWSVNVQRFGNLYMHHIHITGSAHGPKYRVRCFADDVTQQSSRRFTLNQVYQDHPELQMCNIMVLWPLDLSGADRATHGHSLSSCTHYT